MAKIDSKEQVNNDCRVASSQINESPARELMTELLQTECTRKEFLKGIAIGSGAFLTLGAFGQLTRPIVDQYIASTKAGFSNNWFLDENSLLLPRLRIGGSFSPEQASYLSNDGEKGGNPQELLRIIVEDLNIKDLRLGIRWSHAMIQENKVDISGYEPYINYCLEKGVNLCLNVGPIKTFRWPEQHIPYFVKETGLPPINSVITADMEIAKRAKNYLDLLFSRLDSVYGKGLQPTIQLENEPHINFGELGYTMSNDYIHGLVDLAKPFFPNSKFLFNTGPFVVESVTELMKQLHNEGTKTVYGVDYYYKIDDHTNKLSWLMDLPVLKDLDLLTLSKICGRSILPNGLHDLDIEVTEGQFEGWGKFVKPGNSAKEFRYLLYRCINDIFGAQTDINMLVRLWGLEAFAQKIRNKTITSEHKEIRELILAINYG